MKYDDASWHFEASDFPRELPQSAGATHIGIYVAWVIFNGLASDDFQNDFANQIQDLKARQITPGDFVWRFMEGKFSDNDLSDDGKSFTDSYYVAGYLKDFGSKIKENLVSEYMAPDTWDTYQRVSADIDHAYQEWVDSLPYTNN
jgi:hypothetical protein